MRRPRHISQLSARTHGIRRPRPNGRTTARGTWPIQAPPGKVTPTERARRRAENRAARRQRRRTDTTGRRGDSGRGRQ